MIMTRQTLPGPRCRREYGKYFGRNVGQDYDNMSSKSDQLLVTQIVNFTISITFMFTVVHTRYIRHHASARGHSP